MTETGFDAPAMLAPATLPAWAEEAGLLLRPVLAAGGTPVAVVVLVEIDAKGAG